MKTNLNEYYKIVEGDNVYEEMLNNPRYILSNFNRINKTKLKASIAREELLRLNIVDEMETIYVTNQKEFNDKIDELYREKIINTFKSLSKVFKEDFEINSLGIYFKEDELRIYSDKISIDFYGKLYDIRVIKSLSLEEASDVAQHLKCYNYCLEEYKELIEELENALGKELDVPTKDCDTFLNIYKELMSLGVLDKRGILNPKELSKRCVRYTNYENSRTAMNSLKISIYELRKKVIFIADKNKECINDLRKELDDLENAKGLKLIKNALILKNKQNIKDKLDELIKLNNLILKLLDKISELEKSIVEYSENLNSTNEYKIQSKEELLKYKSLLDLLNKLGYENLEKDMNLDEYFQKIEDRL